MFLTLVSLLVWVRQGFPIRDKTAAMLNQSVGYGAGKKIKGRNRFVSVDILGLILSVFVTAASQTEREGGKVVLKRLKEKGTRISRLHTIWVDGGFTGDTFMMWVKWWMDKLLCTSTRHECALFTSFKLLFGTGKSYCHHRLNLVWIGFFAAHQIAKINTSTFA